MLAELGAQRARAQQWLIYLMSTFQPEVMIQFHAERYFPDDVAMQQALRSASLRELELQWKIIEDALDPGPWLLGETYSICDVLFVMQAIWKENQPADLSKLPNSVRLLKSAFKRPAVQRVIAIHQIENQPSFGKPKANRSVARDSPCFRFAVRQYSVRHRCCHCKDALKFEAGQIRRKHPRSIPAAVRAPLG